MGTPNKHVVTTDPAVQPAPKVPDVDVVPVGELAIKLAPSNVEHVVVLDMETAADELIKNFA